VHQARRSLERQVGAEVTVDEVMRPAKEPRP
jgi:hypothetical protein